MFLIVTKYVKPLPEVDAHVAAHRAHLAKYYAEGKLIVSGPQQPRTGGVILAHNMTREEAEAFMRADPFTTAGMAEYTITEFLPVKHAPELAALLQPEPQQQTS